MPLALTARFTFDPRRILKDRWTHDMAHAIVFARAIYVRAPLRLTKPVPEPATDR